MHSSIIATLSKNQLNQLESEMIYGSAKKIYNTLDLATIKFRSSKSYPLAQFTDSSKTINQETIYTAGFPGDQSKLRFSKGKLIANVKIV